MTVQTTKASQILQSHPHLANKLMVAFVWQVYSSYFALAGVPLHPCPIATLVHCSPTPLHPYVIVPLSLTLSLTLTYNGTGAHTMGGDTVIGWGHNGAERDRDGDTMGLGYNGVES